MHRVYTIATTMLWTPRLLVTLGLFLAALSSAIAQPVTLSLQCTGVSNGGVTSFLTCTTALPAAPPERFVGVQQFDGTRIALNVSLIGAVEGDETVAFVCHDGTFYGLDIGYPAFLQQIGWDAKPEIVHTTNPIVSNALAFDPAKVSTFFPGSPGLTFLNLHGCLQVATMDYDVLLQQLD